MHVYNSIDHLIKTHPEYENGQNHNIYLHCDEFKKETGFFEGLFSSKRKYSFHGDLNVDYSKSYDDVHGVLSVNYNTGSLHYSVYNKNEKLLFEFDSEFSFSDYQDIIYSYIDSNYLNELNLP